MLSGIPLLASTNSIKPSRANSGTADALTDLGLGLLHRHHKLSSEFNFHGVRISICR